MGSAALPVDMSPVRCLPVRSYHASCLPVGTYDAAADGACCLEGDGNREEYGSGENAIHTCMRRHTRTNDPRTRPPGTNDLETTLPTRKPVLSTNETNLLSHTKKPPSQD